jgi:hypothetical protein
VTNGGIWQVPKLTRFNAVVNTHSLESYMIQINHQRVGQQVDAQRTASIAMLSLSVSGIIWFAFLSLSNSSDYVLRFDLTAAVFVFGAIAYLSFHGLQGATWTSIPVLLTFRALLGFFLVPAFGFAMGYDTLDAQYTMSMLVTLIGFFAFWIASSLLKRNSVIRFTPAFAHTTARVKYIAITMLTIGVGGNLVLWKTGLFAYASDPGLRSSYSAVIQWLNLSSNLLIYSLVVAAIEVFGKRSPQRFMRIVLWIIVTFSVAFGIVSGMKSGPITPFLYLMFVYVITRQRVPRYVILLPIFLIVLIYPFVTAFRGNLNSGYRAQFNTLQGLEDTVSRSFDDAFRSFGSNSADTSWQSLQDTAGRLSYLSYVRDVASLPYPELLNGDERVWLAPIYPFVPRFLWPEKPILNKGQRLSMLLGRGSESSSALTPIGDLYALFGAYGVVAGMFVWGVCLQSYVNAMSVNGMTERRLFVYMVMLPPLVGFEADVTSLIAGCVQSLMVAMIISVVVYGRYGRSPSIERPPSRLKESRQS